MDRLTVKSEIIDGHYTLKCMCSFGRDGVPDDVEACYEYCERQGQCDQCGIMQAFDRLAAYEDTGLTPEQIVKMKDEYSDTYQAHLNQLLEIKDNCIEKLQADNKRLYELVDIIEKTIRGVTE